MLLTAALQTANGSPDFSSALWIGGIGGLLLAVFLNNVIRNALVRAYKLEDVFGEYHGWEAFEKFTYGSVGFYIAASLWVIYLLVGYFKLWKAHPTWFESGFGIFMITFGLTLVLFVAVQTATTFIALTLGKGAAVAAKKIAESKAGQSAGQKIHDRRQAKLDAKQQQLGLTTSLADRFGGGAQNAQQPAQPPQPPQNNGSQPP